MGTDKKHAFNWKSAVAPRGPVGSKIEHASTTQTTDVKAEHARRLNEEVADWLTRNEAVDMLSCSAQTLANYERRGELHPKKAYRADHRGVEHLVIVYSPKELSKLASKMHRNVVSPRSAGEMAARAYELFDANCPDKEIVKELRMEPDAVDALKEKWRDDGGADLIITPIAKEALSRSIAPFNTVAELVDHAVQFRRTLENELGVFKTLDDLIEKLIELKHSHDHG